MFEGDEKVVFLIEEDDGVAKKEGGRGYLVTGNCMSSLLVPGDRLEIVPIDKKLRVGWVVLYPLDGIMRVHRVIKTGKDSFWARGDNIEKVEGPIEKKLTVGKVDAVWREGVRIRPLSIISPIVGMARSVFIRYLRFVAVKALGVESFSEKVLSRKSMVEIAKTKIIRKLCGEVYFEIVRSQEKILGELLSCDWSIGSVGVEDIEGQIKRGEISLLVLGGRKKKIIGKSVVMPLDSSKRLECARVLAIWLPRWARGVGLGSELLRELIFEARKSGYRRIGGAVDEANCRALSMLQSFNFFLVPGSELRERGGRWCSLDKSGKLWLERTL